MYSKTIKLNWIECASVQVDVRILLLMSRVGLVEQAPVKFREQVRGGYIVGKNLILEENNI